MSQYPPPPGHEPWNQHGQAPPPQDPVYCPPPNPPPPNKKRNWPLIFGILIGIFFLLVVLPCFGIFGFLAYFGAKSPETFAQQGHQIKGSTRQVIADLQLVEEGDTIHWFYSDAFIDAREGMYFFTDKELILYVNEWEEKKMVVPLADIVDVELERVTAFLEDSTVWVTTEDEEEYWFPVSSEKDNDIRFAEDLQKKVEEARQAAGLN